MVGKSQQQKNDNAGGYSKEVESFLPLIVFLIEKKIVCYLYMTRNEK